MAVNLQSELRELVIPPSSDPNPHLEQGENYITDPGQVCFERVLPSEAHFYKPYKAPQCTDDPLCPLPLDAVGYVSKLWRKHDLNVYFMKPHQQENSILAWAAEWSKYCAIIFHKTLSPENSDIRVDFNAGGSWSYIGTDAATIPRESFTLNLGFVDRSTVLHEFGHSLGLIHEHQSPFKGGFEWNRDEVIKALSGPPNYWDMDRIENNMFKRYKRKDLDGSLYDPKSIMHYAFPRAWIKGDGYPEGIDRNQEISERDKEHVKRLYGPSRFSGRPNPGGSGSGGGRRTTIISPVAPEHRKPITSLPPPVRNSIHDVQAYEPHRGELSGQGAELLIRFHTSTRERPQYTVRTHGDCDMVIALLGPDDYTNVIKVNDDGAGDGKNSKIVQKLMPDKDYFVQIQTFDPKGGKFEFSITAW